MHRRHALGLVGLASLAALAPQALGAQDDGAGQAGSKPGLKPGSQPGSQPDGRSGGADATPNPISLAQWSLHRRFGFGKSEERDPNPRDPMDFAKIAKEEFGLTRIEYVNSFYRPRIGEKSLAAEMRKRCDDLGVSSLLIMCDGEGLCGAADEKARAQFAANHEQWLALGRALGCHSIRVNAIGEGSKDEQAKRCADGLSKLVAVAKPFGLSVIVENHGGLSSDGAWLAGVIKSVGDSACGTLPDFGNWRDGGGVLQDPVRNVALVMPFAKAVSAKSYDFDGDGNDTLLDYPRLMAEVHKAGYTGSVGIEYEGKKLSEHDGILATKRLLERLGCRA